MTLDEIAVAGGGGRRDRDDRDPDGAGAEGADRRRRRGAHRAPARTSVSLRDPDRLTIDAGLEVGGTLEVDGAGDLVLDWTTDRSRLEQVILLRGGEDLPIRAHRRARHATTGDLR